MSRGDSDKGGQWTRGDSDPNSTVGVAFPLDHSRVRVTVPLIRVTVPLVRVTVPLVRVTVPLVRVTVPPISRAKPA